MNKNSKKEMLLIISSFLMGIIVMFLWMNQKQETIIMDQSSLSPAIEKIEKAVVEINSDGTIGSGFIYKKDSKYGYILTNEHVLKEKEDITVYFNNKAEEKATLLGSDSYSDIAVIRVPKKNCKQVANITSSESSKVGDRIFVVGSPLGHSFQGTVTAGIISGKDRFVSFSKEDMNFEIGIKEIQIDAPINQGNSGGPVVNAKGEVIGICSLKITDLEIEGMGFAIPIEEAMRLVERLEEGKEIIRPHLGIGMANIDDTASLVNNNIDIMKEHKQGIIITKVEENSQADRAHLQKGDIILKVDEEDIQNTTHFRYELYKHEIGDTIHFVVERNGSKKSISLKLEEK